MDPATLAQYGPWGLLALVLPVIGRLWTRNNELQDARLSDHKAASDLRIEDHRQHAVHLRENEKVLERALDVLEGKSRA